MKSTNLQSLQGVVGCADMRWGWRSSEGLGGRFRGSKETEFLCRVSAHRGIQRVERNLLNSASERRAWVLMSDTKPGCGVPRCVQVRKKVYRPKRLINVRIHINVLGEKHIPINGH